MRACSMTTRVCDTLGGSFRTPSVSEGPLTDSHEWAKGRPNHKAAAPQGGRSLTVAVLKRNPEAPWLLPAESVTGHDDYSASLIGRKSS